MQLLVIERIQVILRMCNNKLNLFRNLTSHSIFNENS
jgi:hypothetical protein